MTLSLGFAIAAYVVFALTGVALAIIDARTHRLPNALVLPLWAVCALLLAASTATGSSAEPLLRALLGSVVLFAAFLALRIASPRGMGGGDVKLAGVVGMLLAWIGWEVLIVGVAAGFVLGGLYGAILLASRRANRRTAIAYGPWMLAGAWLVLGTSFLTG